MQEEIAPKNGYVGIAKKTLSIQNDKKMCLTCEVKKYKTKILSNYHLQIRSGGDSRENQTSLDNRMRSPAPRS